MKHYLFKSHSLISAQVIQRDVEQLSSRAQKIESELQTAEQELQKSIRMSQPMSALKALTERVGQLQEQQRKVKLQRDELQSKASAEECTYLCCYCIFISYTDLTPEEEAQLRDVSDEIECLEVTT